VRSPPSSNGEWLLGLINDILDLSKIEAGKLTIERVDCEPVALVGDVVSLMRAQAVDKGLSFSVEYQSVVPGRVRSDPTRVRQILTNLLANAIKFTETGSVRAGR
jgi:signal transduction histidine kinase